MPYINRFFGDTPRGTLDPHWPLFREPDSKYQKCHQKADTYYFCLKAEDKLKAEEEIPDADEENTIPDGAEDVNFDDEDMDFDQVINKASKSLGGCANQKNQKGIYLVFKV